MTAAFTRLARNVASIAREFTKAEWVSAFVSLVSVIVAVVAIVISVRKDTGDELAKDARDWQKGFVFKTLLASTTPLSVEDIQKVYDAEAKKVRDKYRLNEKDLSPEQIYSLLVDLMGTQAIKMLDRNLFAVRTDDDATIDRRIAFDLMQFARAHEYQYSYADFSTEFAKWHAAQRQAVISIDKVHSVLLIAMQNNLVQMVPKPNDTIKCIGEVKQLFVASQFELRSRAPTILPPSGAALQPCPPKQ